MCVCNCLRRAFYVNTYEWSKLLTHSSIACDSIYVFNCIAHKTYHMIVLNCGTHKVLLSCHNKTKQDEKPIFFWISFHFIHVASTIHSECGYKHSKHTHTLYLVREERKKTDRNKENSKKIANSLQTFRSLANMWSTLINVGEIKLKPKLAPWNTSLKVIRRA